MKILLAFTAILVADTLLLIAALAFLFAGNWPAAAVLFGIGMAGNRYFTYRLEHGL